MNIKDDFKQMSPYEKRKLQVDFMRFIATLGAPFIIVGLQLIFKHILGF